MMALTRQFTDVENSESALPGDPREGILGPIPAYAVADISGRYRAKHWSVDFGINNLFNATYFTRRALGYPGPGILPSAPRNFYVGIGVDLKSKKKPPRRSTGVLSVSE
jgi:Fe(3+) dicitrate transport protein